MKRNNQRGHSGVAIVYIVICLTVLLGFCSFWMGMFISLYAFGG